MMYPNHPGPGKTLNNTALANDSRDQLTNNYPANVTWAGSTIHNTGFVKDVIEATNGVAVSKQLNYAGNSGGNIFLCLIEGYWARGSSYGDDADMGWNCTFRFDDSARKVTFTLAPSYSSEGKIRATVLAFNTNAYTLHHLYFFRAFGDNPSPICIGDAEYTDFTSTPRYNVTPYLTYPSGSIPIVTVTRYDTWSDNEPDDDMSFGVYLENNTINAQAWDGCGLIEGWVAVISPSSSDYKVQNCWLTAGDYSPYNSSGGSTFNLPSTSPQCNVSIQDGWNNEVFSSLAVYNANGDDHFSASNIVSDNGNILRTTLWADYGDDKSNVWFEVIGLKSRR